MKRLSLILAGAAALAVSAAIATAGSEQLTPACSDALVADGKLTIGTDNPAYPPWFDGGVPKGSKWKINDPSTGKGFESAVAYAVAGKLGFTRAKVQWVYVPFNKSFAPGPKNFDFDINQISYSPQRAKAVDFSASYYDVNQALVSVKGNPITKARTRAALKRFKLGAPIGTTSYEYIVKNVKPSSKPLVYNTLNNAISALKAKQVDGIVVDLPTAFFITAVQIENGVIVGQFPAVGTQERFGMVLRKGSPLTACVNRALAQLKSSGQLARIQKTWLSDKVQAPVLR